MSGIKTEILTQPTHTPRRQPTLSPAQLCVHNLLKSIHTFEKQMSSREEVATYLASFGSRILLRLEALYPQGPNLVALEGKLENGERVTLVQHYSQFNVLLTTSPVADGRKAKRLGFSATSKAVSE